MEANARQSRFLQQRFEPPVCRSRIHRQLRTGRLRENPLADRIFLPRPQQRRNAFRQDNCAVALARFRVAEGVDALPLAVQRPGDSERPGLCVEVAPHERADLAAPQAGHKLRVEEIPPDIVLLNRLQERIQLLLVQHLHWLVVGFRRSRVLGRIFRNDVRLHRLKPVISSVMRGKVAAVKGTAPEALMLSSAVLTLHNVSADLYLFNFYNCIAKDVRVVIQKQDQIIDRILILRARPFKFFSG